jgi:hypothetical protein
VAQVPQEQVAPGSLLAVSCHAGHAALDRDAEHRSRDVHPDPLVARLRDGVPGEAAAAAEVEQEAAPAVLREVEELEGACGEGGLFFFFFEEEVEVGRKSEPSSPPSKCSFPFSFPSFSSLTWISIIRELVVYLRASSSL